MSRVSEICVVITSHNYARYIGSCIQSVKQQVDAPDWRLVVVDDGSTDETRDILRHHQNDARITTIHLDGKGLAASGNVGISSVKSRWVLRLDADDWLESDALRKLHEHALGSGADFIYGDLRLVDEVGRNLGVLSQAEEWIGSTLERSPVGSGALYRREVWESVGGYDESLRYQEDFDFWLKVVEKFRTAHVPRTVYSYRQHFNSMSGNRRLRAASRALVKQRAAQRRGLLPDGKALVVLSTIPLLSDRIDPTACLLPIDGEPLIERACRGLTEIDCAHELLIETVSPEVKQWAETRGLRTTGGTTSFHVDANSGDNIGDRRHGDVDIVLRASPYYPLLEPYRYKEVIATLLLGGYGRVDTTVASSALTLVPTGGGWRTLPTAAHEACLPGAMRMAGGLTAIRTQNNTDRQGCVEIVWPEDHLVRDMDTLRAAQQMQSCL